MGVHHSKSSSGTMNEKRKTKNKSNNIDDTNIHREISSEEIDNANFQHFLFKKLWGKSYSAPIDEMLKAGGKVLDVGCSTGSFLLDCALEFPKSEFVGIDISPIFPTQIKPPNVTFQIHDIRKPFLFEDESFDFIHLGFIRNYVNKESWKLVIIPEILRILKPGGWVEVCI
ncbi:1697_t:CDS:2 [Diversispora eburnea]|uniref:1697_t:CDS:1 n=1 Tax=Diversispora eburnea TaxID=1213867 RepID=A0A9N8W7S7_9GLOM|nr:1697_t:CDS:2 [Diversispora eburnea]